MPEINLDERDPLWYKDAIIYELHIKAFNDSNADGIGDLAGLLEKIDYLQDLGVTAIWLLPFYPSPQRDGGYDISDYLSVNPDYGTIKQLRKLVKEAHARGLKIITELIMNHTSDQHPWFQRARRAQPGSRYRDFYVWSDSPEKYKDVRIIFQDFETSNWTWDPVAKAYYWHRFYSHQPDLNYDNPEVQQEMFKVIDYWVDMGIDGFRLDAVPYLFERDGTNCENLPETHTFLKKLRAHIDQSGKDIMLLAEANMWPEDSASYFGEGDECHMNYHFPIMPRMFMALKMEDRYPLIDIIDQTPDIPDNCQWGMFLRNHDELTLEMVTDEERDYMYRAYNKDTLSRINLGIRHRLAPLLDNHRQKIELMNCLLFSLPGTPVIYYGDEIGMGDNIHLGDRDGVRTPMQWSLDRNAGFSKAHPHSLYLPLINDPEYHYHTLNVETMQNNASSLLWWMKRMIRVRKRFKAFGRGDIKFLSPENAKVLAFTRSYEDEHLLVLANLSRHAQVVDLEMDPFEQYTPIEVFGQTAFPTIQRGPNRFTLGPFGYYWFALTPEARDVQRRRGPVRVAWEPDRWLQLAKGKGATLMEEEILPQFLAKNPRYMAPGRILEKLEIERVEKVNYPGGIALLFIVKASFTEGFPEGFFLPLTLGEGNPAQLQEAPAEIHILSILLGKEKMGYLFEAAETQAFQNFLLENILGQNGHSPARFNFRRRTDIQALHNKGEAPNSRVVKSSGANLSLAFGDMYYLKVFRHIESIPNPDLEVNQRGQDSDLPVPGYLGHLEYQRSNRERPTLALLQPYVSNEGSAWQYFYDVARRFIERIQALPEPPELPRPGDDEHWKILLIGDIPLERATLLGEVVGKLHVGLADPEHPDFRPEGFSLHYQRSLYSAISSQVRATFQQLRKKRDQVAGAKELIDARRTLLDRLKRIYAYKFEAFKTRIHGELHLENVLFTGRGFYVFDFEGDRVRSYSEIRLRKAPTRDLASVVCSLYYTAMSALKAHVEPDPLQESDLFPWAEVWHAAMANAFLKGYLPIARKAGLLPPSSSDLKILLETFMLDRFLHELEFELRNGNGLEQIPLQGLSRILELEGLYIF